MYGFCATYIWGIRLITGHKFYPQNFPLPACVQVGTNGADCDWERLLLHTITDSVKFDVAENNLNIIIQ